VIKTQNIDLGEFDIKTIEMFKTIHISVEKSSLSFYDMLKRKNYVTPTSYLGIYMYEYVYIICDRSIILCIIDAVFIVFLFNFDSILIIIRNNQSIHSFLNP
jgi:hypothetical protein